MHITTKNSAWGFMIALPLHLPKQASSCFNSNSKVDLILLVLMMLSQAA